MCLAKARSVEEILAGHQGAAGYEHAVSLRDDGIKRCEQGDYSTAMMRLDEAAKAVGASQ